MKFDPSRKQITFLLTVNSLVKSICTVLLVVPLQRNGHSLHELRENPLEVMSDEKRSTFNYTHTYCLKK